jgi:hypothetical protein
MESKDNNPKKLKARVLLIIVLKIDVEFCNFAFSEFRTSSRGVQGSPTERKRVSALLQSKIKIKNQKSPWNAGGNYDSHGGSSKIAFPA